MRNQTEGPGLCFGNYLHRCQCSELLLVAVCCLKTTIQLLHLAVQLLHRRLRAL